ncbi:ester cyclase [Actinophytocola sp. KF-1]
MDLAAFYRRYLAVCDAHRFGDIGEFVAGDVRVNDAPTGLDGYAAGLRDLVAAFPDYHWDLRQLVVDGDCLAARLTGTGTHTGTFLDVPATGRAVTVRELAMYRIEDGKIVECWGDLGSSIRDRLTT